MKIHLLSIRQPWAWAIFYAGKDIENRVWKTDYRGILYIHASGTYDTKGFYWLEKQGIFAPYRHHSPQGAIIGKVELIDCVSSHDSKWFEGPYGFVLGNPEPLQEPIPYRGLLGIFNGDIAA